MRTLLFLLLFTSFFYSQNIIAQQPVLGWGVSVGGASYDYGYSVATDDLGYSYVTGSFTGTVDFDPSAGVFNLTSSSGYGIFVKKLDPSGNLIWARSMTGSGFGEKLGNSISVDNLGNVCLTGWFTGTVDFNPGAGVFNLTATTNGRSIFVQKLDPNGDFLWAKAMGGTYWEQYGYSIVTDNMNNVLVAGHFQGTVDFDPGAGVFQLVSNGNIDLFVQKLDPNGNLLWAKSMGSTGQENGYSIATDLSGNVFVTGNFMGTADFDPNAGVSNLSSNGSIDVYVVKLDGNGNHLWSKSFGGTSSDIGNFITTDAQGNCYTTGKFKNTVDFDPGAAVYNLSSNGDFDFFIQKMDLNGNFLWAKTIGGASYDDTYAIKSNSLGDLFLTGVTYSSNVDFDPGVGTHIYAGGYFILRLDSNGNFKWVETINKGLCLATSKANSVVIVGEFGGTWNLSNLGNQNDLVSNGGNDIFILKLNTGYKIVGDVYRDVSPPNCLRDPNELGFSNRLVTIQPGNIFVSTSASGFWFIDSLPVGTYTATADTSDGWYPNCSASQSFTVVHPDSSVVVPSIGLFNTFACYSPSVSVNAPFLRRGFSNQALTIQACNLSNSTLPMDSAYVILELDTIISAQSSTHPFTYLGNNRYRFDLGTMAIGHCVNIQLSCTVNNNAVIGQTLCMKAELYPRDLCVYDTIPNPYPGNYVSPCTLPWDNSSLSVDGSCSNNDSTRFVIYNTGAPGVGDMACFAPVRVFLDGQLNFQDSIQLPGGDSIVYMFYGNGQTWRLEVDQHPLHPGNSHPNTSLELCGNSANWTANLINLFPHDDADPIIDIYCGIVTVAIDPNDKTGYPLGAGATNDILPNQDIEYVIRFQNTGTDTAFTVVIRDTLSTNLDIFSVISGASSHNNNFRIYGQRILEWTFDNIMLPDSNVNEPASHGFVTFKVNQAPNLPLGTAINNTAAIYFDFNAPVITNTYQHTINDINILAINLIPGEELLMLKVYPNPTTGVVNIEREETTELSIKVLNQLGQQLLFSKNSDALISVPLNNLPQGVYYLWISDGTKTAIKKVIKQ